MARILAQKGRKVAAVSAASAYHPGGGASSGGRHALEESFCICSPLIRSLFAAEDTSVRSDQGPGTASGLQQHIPSLACVVSPHVEIFRETADYGYGFLDKPISIHGVISVAMFNRNPGVTDSPLDSPEDPMTYVRMTGQKFEAIMGAAIDLGVEVLVMPDIGMVLRKYNGAIPQVAIVSATAPFVNACMCAFRGEDPLGSGAKAEGEKVEQILASIVQAPDYSYTKPRCRYGGLCHIRDPEHLARFSHPEAATLSLGATDADATSPLSPCPIVPGTAASWRSPASVASVGSTGPAAGAGATGAGVIGAASVGAGAALGGVVTRPAKPMCQYGVKCYNQNPQHRAQFEHPDPTTETKEQAEERRRQNLAHDLLNYGKLGDWKNAKALLTMHPEIVNIRPDVREYALIHHAGYQLKFEIMEWMRYTMKADLMLKTRFGKTLEDIMQEVLSTSCQTDHERKVCQDIQRWLASEQGRAGAPSAPTATSAAASAAAAMSVYDNSPALARGAVLVVQSTANADVNGDYEEVEDRFSRYPVFRKKVVKAGDAKCFLFYNPLQTMGWVIDIRVHEGTNPFAYLGPSACGGNPCAKGYHEAWTVKVITRLVGESYQADNAMKITRRLYA